MTVFCAFPGCDNPKSPKAAMGLCSSHYWQHHKGRELTTLSYRRNRCVPWLKAHVDHDGDDCLIWPFQHAKDSGAAIIKYRGRPQVASRVMCEMKRGKPPTPDHEAAHSCGKGHLGCINPNHLRWATPKENAADKIVHGTVVRGEGICWSKLKDGDVKTIRALAGKVSQRELGRMFGIGQGTVGKVVRRETWSHV